MKKVLLFTGIFLAANIIASDSSKPLLVIENNSPFAQKFGLIFKFGEPGHDPKYDVKQVYLEPGAYVSLKTDQLPGRTVFMRTNPRNKNEHAIVDIEDDTNGIIFLAEFDCGIKPRSVDHDRKDSSDDSTSIETP